jgi:hypothetical protein
MLGKIIGTYVFAVQPVVEHARRLAEAIADELSPPGVVLRRASQVVEEILDTQRRTQGIDVTLELGW